MQFIPASTLSKQETSTAMLDEAAAADAAKAVDPAVTMSNLASYLEMKWSQAKRHKIDIETRMLRSKRQRNGEYDPEKLAAIRAVSGLGTTPVYVMLTETKCRAAESWIREIIFQAGKIPWSIEPTPIPELPPEVESLVETEVFSSIIASMGPVLDTMDVQTAIQFMEANSKPIMDHAKDQMQKQMFEKAVEAAGRMQRLIEDQFADGGWENAVNECIHDLCTYHAAFIKGPVVTRQPVRKRSFNNVTQKYENLVVDEFVTTYERRSPFDIYPLPGGSLIEDVALFDKIKLSPMRLQQLIGVRGYDDEAIEEVLKDYEAGKLREWTAIDTERAVAENRDASSVWEANEIDCLEFWGPIRGKDLLEWGLSPDVIKNENMFYEACCWKIGRHVIKAMINPDPEGKKPFSKVCFTEDPDNFWNKSLPEIIRHLQDMCNSCARAIVANVGIASGPQVEVNTDRIPDGADNSIWPWKIWESTSNQMEEGAAVRFYQPQLVVDKLQALYAFFLNLADDESGVPRFVHGNPSGTGALSTAAGFSMLISQAARGIKSVIANIDSRLIEPTVRRQYNYNLDYHEDISDRMIGDMKIVAKGTASLVAKEQQAVRKRELLATTLNPVDLEITGKEGRKEMLRDLLLSMDIDPDKIIRSENRIAELVEHMGAAAPNTQGQIPGSETLDAAGNKVVGSDTASFQETPQEGMEGMGAEG